MQVCHSINEIRKKVHLLREDGSKIGLVPTMGALHAGHISLVEYAQRDVDHVIVSIFVNPMQFESLDDLANYPSKLDEDLAKLRGAGVVAVFIPQSSDIYPDGAETIVETKRLSGILHGAVRPGHFRGVTTVVCKLLNIVGADFVCFGEKDYQQLVVIKRMVEDLFMPVKIIGVPTMREPDGLAMSSRNERLTKEDRVAAIVMSQSMSLAEDLVIKGTTVEKLKETVSSYISAESRATLKSADVTTVDLFEVFGTIDKPVAITISAEFGDVLLLDQRVAVPLIS